MTRARRAAVAATAMLAAASLAACSSTTSGHQDGSSTTGSSKSSTSPASRATLESTLLRAGDLPSEWVAKAKDNSDGSGGDAVGAQLASCIGVANPGSDDAGEVDSPEFTLDQSSVSSNSQPLMATDNQNLHTLINSPKSVPCLEQAFRTELAKSLPSTVRLTSVKASISGKLAGQPDNTVLNFGARIVITAQGQTLQLYFSIVGLESSTVQASVEFDGFGAPIPAAVQSAALNAVSARVART